MGLAHRMAEVFRAKANIALERAEDPRELLDYSYTLQQDLLARVRRGVVDVATSRKRIEYRQEKLRESAERLQGRAEQVLSAGDEELARETLARRARLLGEADELAGRRDELRAEEQRLAAAAERLRAKVDAFGRRKEILKARYTLADAETYVNETVTGVSEEMTDAGLATRRALDKLSQTRGRAAALGELLESGTLPGTVPGAPAEALPDEFETRLNEAAARAAAEDELRAMKARLSDRTPPSPEASGHPPQPDG